MILSHLRTTYTSSQYSLEAESELFTNSEDELQEKEINFTIKQGERNKL